MKQAIDQATPSEIMAGPLDEVATRFAAGFLLEVPELTEGAVSVALDEAKVDVSGDFRYLDFGPGPHRVAGIRASYFVPFRGNAEMFRVKPSTFSSVRPRASVEGDELRFTFERPGQPVAETKLAFDEELSRVKEYLAWLAEDARAYNESLLPIARQLVEARSARLSELAERTSSLGIPIRSASTDSVDALPPRAAAGPRPAEESIAAGDARRYDVALSFAGEDRAYVEDVARGLKSAGVEVFYDDFEKSTLWGKNLIEHLAQIYQHNSRYVVMFVSEHYVRKAWPKHERQHAQARAFMANEEYILPARFDDAEVPGMTNTVGYVDLRTVSPPELVGLILAKLGR